MLEIRAKFTPLQRFLVFARNFPAGLQSTTGGRKRDAKAGLITTTMHQQMLYIKRANNQQNIYIPKRRRRTRKGNEHEQRARYKYEQGTSLLGRNVKDRRSEIHFAVTVDAGNDEKYSCSSSRREKTVNKPRRRRASRRWGKGVIRKSGPISTNGHAVYDVTQSAVV
jgi:hypothetical protein